MSKSSRPNWNARQNKTTSRNGHTIQLKRGVYYVDGVAQPDGVTARQLFRSLAAARS